MQTLLYYAFVVQEAATVAVGVNLREMMVAKGLVVTSFPLFLGFFYVTCENINVT